MSSLLFPKIDPIHTHAHGFCVTWTPVPGHTVVEVCVRHDNDDMVLLTKEVPLDQPYMYVEGLSPQTTYVCTLNTQHGYSEQVLVTTTRLNETSYICREDACEFYHDDNDAYNLRIERVDKTFRMQWTPEHPNIDHSLVYLVYYYHLGSLKLGVLKQTHTVSESVFVLDTTCPPFTGAGVFTCDITIKPVMRPTMIFGQGMKTSLTLTDTVCIQKFTRLP